MTDASLGYGSTYEIFYDSEYVELDEVIEINPGEETADRVDATHMKSPNRRRERIAGLIDVGTGSVVINWVPNSPTDILIRALRDSGAVANHRITFPDGEWVLYPAVITGFGKSLPIDDRMTATMNFEVSGAETWST